MDADRQTDGVKGKSACAPYGKDQFRICSERVHRKRPSTLLVYGVQSNIYTVHTYRVHTLVNYLLTCLPTYRNAYIYITSAVQELTSKLACLLLTNRPSWTRSRKKIGDSEK